MTDIPEPERKRYNRIHYNFWDLNAAADDFAGNRALYGNLSLVHVRMRTPGYSQSQETHLKISDGSVSASSPSPQHRVEALELAAKYLPPLDGAQYERSLNGGPHSYGIAPGSLEARLPDLLRAFPASRDPLLHVHYKAATPQALDGLTYDSHPRAIRVDFR